MNFMHKVGSEPFGTVRVSSEPNALNIGPRLRRARLSKGMRMRDLAQVVGCDESMISKIEAGKVMPSLPMLDKMVHALDREMASFLGLRVDDCKLVRKSEARMKVPSMRCAAPRMSCMSASCRWPQGICSRRTFMSWLPAARTSISSPIRAKPSAISCREPSGSPSIFDRTVMHANAYGCMGPAMRPHELMRSAKVVASVSATSRPDCPRTGPPVSRRSATCRQISVSSLRRALMCLAIGGTTARRSSCRASGSRFDGCVGGEDEPELGGVPHEPLGR